MLSIISGNLAKLKSDCVIIPVCEDKDIHELPAIKDIVKRIAKIKDFSGKKDEMLTLYCPEGLKAERLYFVGLGESKRSVYGGSVYSGMLYDLDLKSAF